MAQIIAGPGNPLPPPQALYPRTLTTSPYTAATNRVTLKLGCTLNIPAGQWFVSVTGSISALQFFDPVRLEWVNLLGPGAPWGHTVKSDGFNIRVANCSNAAYGGIVTAPGSGYSQATTIVTAGTGNSSWMPIVGGAIGAFTMDSGGSGYTMTPTVFMASPPAPGIAATALATISGGAVTGITVSGGTAGAGYLVAPSVVILADPTDPALAAGVIVPATAHCVLAGGGTLTGLLMNYFGAPLSSAPTLTVAGQGTGATATTNPASFVAAANDLVTIQPAVG